MAIRTRAVRPDVAFGLESGETIAVVSEDALVEEVVSVVRTVNFAGGTMSVVVHRHPTGVPHEMVTVGALIQWQDRTDAKPQPEPAAPAQAVQLEGVVREAGAQFGDLASERAEQDWRDVQEAVARGAEIRVAGSLEPDLTPEELERQLGAEAREEHDDAPIPEEAVVIGAPVGAPVGPQGYEPPQVHETPVSHNRPTRADGAGSGALPFQKGDQPGDPPRPVEGGVNLADIAHGDASSLPRGEAVPAPAGSSEGIEDGFVADADEDVDAIPEHLRG